MRYQIERADMDIDVYSRLLHEEYLARQNYNVNASLNIYGLTMDEEITARIKFDLALKRLNIACDKTRSYLKDATPQI
jgi:hypothetical protein